MSFYRKAVGSLWFIFIVSIVQSVWAEDGDGPINFDQIASGLFFNQLYTYGGWTLYCGYRFEMDKKIDSGRSVTIEHIYPTSKMLAQQGCTSRMQCRESGNQNFVLMEADMHNLYPVWHALITYRNGSWFGEVEGEERRVDDCDVEWKAGVMEPRPTARGNIARSLLYMRNQYGLTLDTSKIEMFKNWSKQDPPSGQEIDRNDKIEAIQGKRNPYVDNPSLVELIK